MKRIFRVSAVPSDRSLQHKLRFVGTSLLVQMLLGVAMSEFGVRALWNTPGSRIVMVLLLLWQLAGTAWLMLPKTAWQQRMRVLLYCVAPFWVGLTVMFWWEFMPHWNPW